jgi:hypothetical protein
MRFGFCHVWPTRYTSSSGALFGGFFCFSRMIVFGRSQREVSKYVWTRQSLRHGYQLRTREVYHECRRFDEALPLLERAVLSQSLAIFAEVGDRYGRAAALHSLVGCGGRSDSRPKRSPTSGRPPPCITNWAAGATSPGHWRSYSSPKTAAETQSTIVDGNARRCWPAGHRRLSLAAVGIRGIGGR